MRFTEDILLVVKILSVLYGVVVILQNILMGNADYFYGVLIYYLILLEIFIMTGDIFETSPRFDNEWSVKHPYESQYLKLGAIVAVLIGFAHNPYFYITIVAFVLSLALVYDAVKR